MKISFIGSGGVACTTAFTVGLKGLFNEMVMLDIYKDYAIGKAIDLRQGLILNNKDVKTIGTDNYNDIKGSDAIVITAGVAGTADRESLLAKNKEIIGDIANKLSNVIPNDEKQPFIVVVTNPLDSILKHFIDVGHFNPKKTIGSGNWLDTARFKYYLSELLHVSPLKIETFTIGQHGQKMVYLLSQTKIDGIPLFDYMKKNNISNEQIKKACEDATNGGATILNLIVKGGTFYGPAVSIYDLLNAYFNNTKETLIASTYCNGEYGIKNCCVGCPIVIGKNGVEEVKQFKITNDEQKELEKAYQFIDSLNNK